MIVSKSKAGSTWFEYWPAYVWTVYDRSVRRSARFSANSFKTVCWKYYCTISQAFNRMPRLIVGRVTVSDGANAKPSGLSNKTATAGKILPVRKTLLGETDRFSFVVCFDTFIKHSNINDFSALLTSGIWSKDSTILFHKWKNSVSHGTYYPTLQCWLPSITHIIKLVSEPQNKNM